MKHDILSLFAMLSVCFSAACAGTRSAPANSGLDVRLYPVDADPSAPRPEGVFHVRGINNGVRAYVPASPFDPDSDAQRVPLPPGSYVVSFSPIVFDHTINSLRNRAPASIVSENPFVVEVGEGEFHTIDVRALTNAPATASRPAQKRMAAR